MEVVRAYISTGISMLVHIGRLKGGIRRVTRISELRKSEDGNYDLNDIFQFVRTGTNEDGIAIGNFQTTGYLPDCLTRFEEEGVEFSTSNLDRRVEVSQMPSQSMNKE